MEEKNDLSIHETLNQIVDKMKKHKFSHIYDNKKAKLYINVYFYDTFLITVNKESIYIFPYKNILFTRGEDIVSIGLVKNTFMINLNKVNKEFKSFIDNLRKNYKEIELNEEEKIEIWNSACDKIQNDSKICKIDLDNQVNKDSLESYYNQKNVKIVNFIKWMICCIVLCSIFAKITFHAFYKYNVISPNTNSSLFILTVIIIASIIFYKKYIERIIAKALIQEYPRKLLFGERGVVLKSSNSIINWNYEILAVNETEKYYFIKNRKTKKIIIISKKQLDNKKHEQFKELLHI